MNAYVNQLIPAAIQEKIKEVLNVFETGAVHGDYANVTVYHDGHNNTKQITYGKTQTTEQGNLHTLINTYINNHGFYADAFKPYLPLIGTEPLGDNLPFISLLRLAGSDPVMQHTEDSFFDNVYFFPACGFFETNRFTVPLSLLVIYDSYIHSGGILPLLRNRFAERTPVGGGQEPQWINDYVMARHNWLKSGADGARPVLAKTAYRTHCLLEQINAGNWNLDKPFMANGILIS